MEINDNETVCGSCGSQQLVRTRTATLLQRFLGALIDGITQSVILIPITVARMGGVASIMEALRGPFMQQQAFILRFTIETFLLGQLVFLILNGYLLLRRGQTIGKLAMSTKITGMDGSLPNFTKIYVLRYFVIGAFRQVPLIGGLITLVDALVIFGKDRRCLHDYIAGTQVIGA
jgi:uncharacterized RDD family membrane protein YckC